MQPILGGSSYASQDSLTANFGLGNKQKGVVDILWPGGVRNRLYNVRKGQHILFPEIPCSYDGDWANTQAYRSCVRTALHELGVAGILTPAQKAKLFTSAMRAFFEQRVYSAASVESAMALEIAAVRAADDNASHNHMLYLPMVSR